MYCWTTYVIVNNINILKVLPLKCNNVFPLYCCAAYCGEQCKTVECFHGNAVVDSLCLVVKLQNILYCSRQYKRT